MPRSRKKKKEGQKKEGLGQELARDTLAIGSILFYVMFIARALTADYYVYVTQLVIAFVVLVIITLFIKNIEVHLARAVILAVFTMLFYNDIKFNIFAIIAFVLMITSAIYLKKEKLQIIKGVLVGTISTIITYYLTPSIANLLNIT